MSKENQDFTGITTIEKARSGAYISKIRAGKPTKTQFEVIEYCKSVRAYQVDNLSDCHDTYLNKGTEVYVHCNY
ncbi:MAG: hypothetical protein ACJASM_002052 [Salibacteraceae bacterium]|jgi:hypothetical protein